MYKERLIEMCNHKDEMDDVLKSLDAVLDSSESMFGVKKYRGRFQI